MEVDADDHFASMYGALKGDVFDMTCFPGPRTVALCADNSDYGRNTSEMLRGAGYMSSYTEARIVRSAENCSLSSGWRSYIHALMKRLGRIPVGGDSMKISTIGQQANGCSASGICIAMISVILVIIGLWGSLWYQIRRHLPE